MIAQFTLQGYRGSVNFECGEEHPTSLPLVQRRGRLRCQRRRRLGGPVDPANDCNSNGVVDICEFGGVNDCDSNGIPDECEPDCDGDGTTDAWIRTTTVMALTDADVRCGRWCDSNGILDSCEPDCDGDGTIDACDLDDDADGIADECDADSCGLTLDVGTVSPT